MQVLNYGGRGVINVFLQAGCSYARVAGINLMFQELYISVMLDGGMALKQTQHKASIAEMVL